MKSIDPNMNVSKQRRKFELAIERAATPEQARYLEGLRDLFERSLAAGQPQSFSHFLPMFEEEFDL